VPLLILRTHRQIMSSNLTFINIATSVEAILVHADALHQSRWAFSRLVLAVAMMAFARKKGGPRATKAIVGGRKARDCSGLVKQSPVQNVALSHFRIPPKGGASCCNWHRRR
jgi:hypothetical protein